MKKLTLFVISLTLVLLCAPKESTLGSAVPNSQSPAPIAGTLNSFYTLKDDGDQTLAAVLYLGSPADLDKAKATLSRTVFKDLTVELPENTQELALEDGEEVYLILPKFQDTTLLIHSQELDDKGQLVIKDELINTTSPVLLTCNQSDIVPSVQLSAKYSDKEGVICPSISLKDGEVTKGEGFYTATVTED